MRKRFSCRGNLLIQESQCNSFQRQQSHLSTDVDFSFMDHPQAADVNHKRKMGKLRDSIFAHLAALNPSNTLAPHVMSHIEQKLPQLIPTSRTPTHPPYSYMIERAISELSDEGGSSGMAISEFILGEYEGLPWGHESFLTHHLEKLCRSRAIVRTNDGCYMFPVQSDDSQDIDRRGIGRLHMQNDVIEYGLVTQKLSCEGNQVQGRETAMVEYVNAAERQLIKATEWQIEVQLEAVETQHGERRSNTKLSKENFPQELEDEVIRDESQLDEPQVGVRSKMLVSLYDMSVPCEELPLSKVIVRKKRKDMSVPCEELPLSKVIVRKKRKKMQKKSASKPCKVSICCGLMARDTRKELYQKKRASKPCEVGICCGLIARDTREELCQKKSASKPWEGSICCGLMARATREELYQKVSSKRRQSKSKPGKKTAALELQICSDQQVEGKSSTPKYYARRTARGISNKHHGRSIP